MRKIFISYRRVDAEFAAGALGRDLRRIFGDEQVFRDKEDIGGGVAWRQEVLEKIDRDSAMLVLIGKDWANAKDARGRRRLDNRDDPLHLEIADGLKDGATILPILLENAQMPSEDELPPELQAFAGINALKLRDGDWHYDLDKICKNLERVGFKPAPLVPPAVKEEEKVESKEDSRAAEPACPALNEVLPGVWQVQIQSPYLSVMGQLNVEMFPTGMFRGQLAGPMGRVAVEGQWQANPANNQIGLQGYQTNGFQTAPYVVLVQISVFDRRRIAGMTSGREQVTWQRVSRRS